MPMKNEKSFLAANTYEVGFHLAFGVTLNRPNFKRIVDYSFRTNRLLLSYDRKDDENECVQSMTSTDRSIDLIFCEYFEFVNDSCESSDCFFFR